MKTAVVRVTKDVEIEVPDDWSIEEMEQLSADICTNGISLDKNWDMEKVTYRVGKEWRERLWVKR